jgi:hypothetical protein
MVRILTKGLVCVTIALFIGSCSITGVANATGYTGPVLQVEIRTQFGIFYVGFSVENVGNETAHNITISNISFDGNIIYNSRTSLITQKLDPDRDVYDITEPFLGLGVFTITINVTCDEGVVGTASANGIAFGPCFFIP